VAATDRGLCAVLLGTNDQALEANLRLEYPNAQLERGGEQLQQWVQAIAGQMEGSSASLALPLDVQASVFQWKVWKALQAIPRGATRSYSEIAAAVGQPNAARAVAQACAHNRLALVIPCHRVVRADGKLGGYRWGVQRKRRLLEAEQASPTGSEE
jgi:AraC family transcriptional regulator of adaptative response/methylated-DNA-[protein]-cysteine methyltransferase